jgi:hypothetical protein
MKATQRINCVNQFRLNDKVLLLVFVREKHVAGARDLNFLRPYHQCNGWPQANCHRRMFEQANRMHHHVFFFTSCVGGYSSRCAGQINVDGSSTAKTH